jgi:predicted nucleic acid-binding protein
MRVLLDTNIVLDWLLDRKPWSDEAAPFWLACVAGSYTPYIPASVTTDIYYIIRRLVNSDAALEAVRQVLTALWILPVDEETIVYALNLPVGDFEDNVAIACAQRWHLDLIITRDVRDFRHSPIPITKPEMIQGT